MLNTPKEKIGVIGVGYIGLPLIAAFASRGFKVVGIDVDRGKMARLKRTYRADIFEPGLNEALSRYRRNISFTAEEEKAIKQCDIILVTVGTPLDDRNQPNFKYLEQVTDSLARRLEPGQLVIFKSTVMPGMTRILAARLEKASGLLAGEDFYVVFCPERTVEGKAMHELYNLPKIVSGINQKSLDMGEKVFSRLGGKVIKVSSLEIAEMAKCVDNTYRVANIAFSNEVGNICEKIGIDGYELAYAVNYTYPRTNLFLPGLGAGGPCLSKDPQILKYFANKNGVATSVIDASIEKNKESTMRLAPEVMRFIKKNSLVSPRMALVGVAFKGKPETDDIRNSPAADIYRELNSKLKNKSFRFCDPFVKEFFGEKRAKNLKECWKDSNIVIFLTNHASFLNIDVRDVLRVAGRPLLIVDCWHNLTDANCKDNRVKIFRIGGNNNLLCPKF